MGHSDSTSLRDLLATEQTLRTHDQEVRVWGDMSHIEPWDEDSTHVAQANDCSVLQVPGMRATEQTYQRIGHLTRTLHDALRELGYHELLADSRDNLPEARDRLAYISRLTGEAAEKVLNAVDQARSLQDEMNKGAAGLHARWAPVAVYAGGEGNATPAGAALVQETLDFFVALQKCAERTNTVLTEIMMAQDFHDLTGQVIRKVVQMAQSLEEQLVKLLLDANVAGSSKKCGEGHLEGPQVTAEGRSDVVVNQAGVDELLASLGF
jgi:chemotaxis protein CheZ